MEYKRPVTGQLSKPARELFVAIKVNVLVGLGQVMSVALLLKSCAATDRDWHIEQGLQRYDDLLPAEHTPGP